MNQFAKYCTSEQTKKAFELGAPLNNTAKCGVPSNAPTIEINGIDYYKPSMQEMITWLFEKFSIFVSIAPHESGKWFSLVYNVTHVDEAHVCAEHYYYDDPYEALDSAIDSALEYCAGESNDLDIK